MYYLLILILWYRNVCTSIEIGEFANLRSSSSVIVWINSKKAKENKQCKYNVRIILILYSTDWLKITFNSELTNCVGNLLGSIICNFFLWIQVITFKIFPSYLLLDLLFELSNSEKNARSATRIHRDSAICLRMIAGVQSLSPLESKESLKPRRFHVY